MDNAIWFLLGIVTTIVIINQLENDKTETVESTEMPGMMMADPKPTRPLPTKPG